MLGYLSMLHTAFYMVSANPLLNGVCEGMYSETRVVVEREGRLTCHPCRPRSAVRQPNHPKHKEEVTNLPLCYKKFLPPVPFSTGLAFFLPKIKNNANKVRDTLNKY
jgi:hypothetical protein